LGLTSARWRIGSRLYAGTERRYAELAEFVRQGRLSANSSRFGYFRWSEEPRRVVHSDPAGVLLAGLFVYVGPLFGEGKLKIVLYYGVGSMTLWELWVGFRETTGAVGPRP